MFVFSVCGSAVGEWVYGSYELVAVGGHRYDTKANKTQNIFSCWWDEGILWILVLINARRHGSPYIEHRPDIVTTHDPWFPWCSSLTGERAKWSELRLCEEECWCASWKMVYLLLVCVCVHMCVCVGMCVSMRVHGCNCARICVCKGVCVCVYATVSMWVWASF